MGPQAIIALVLAAMCFGGGWKIRDWKAGADERAAVEQAAADARRRTKDADTAASFYEKSKATQDVRERVVIKEVTHVVEKAVYLRECLDDDGLRILAEDVQTRAAPGGVTPAVPAASGPH